MMIGGRRCMLELADGGMVSSNGALAQSSAIHTYAVIVAGVFVLVALALSTFLMFEHLTSYKDPECLFGFGMLTYANIIDIIQTGTAQQSPMKASINNFNLIFRKRPIQLHLACLLMQSSSIVYILPIMNVISRDYIDENFLILQEQKWLIGVIFMVPVYTVSSFLSLWHPELSLACNILGNCYEAYALYSFGCYLIACLGGEDRVVKLLEREGQNGPRTPLLESKSNPGQPSVASVEHPLPLNWCMDPWELGQDFYSAAKFGIVQYMILKTLCAILTLLLDSFGLYNDGTFSYEDGYPYITLVLNFSQTWALYCLIQFYAQTHEELKSINPLAKFICFKSIVFATWWQGVVISLLFSNQWVDLGPDQLSGGNFQTALQDFLICFEMAIAAVAHIYIFPATPYQLMGQDRRRGSVSVLADYAAIDSPLDPEEVRESEKPTVIKYPNKDEQRRREVTSLRESVQDVVVVGAGHVVQDMRITVHQAVEEVSGQMPWGKHRKEREKKKLITKDDFWIGSPTALSQQIKGIDDPLLHAGSVSDSGVVRKKSLSYGSGAESSGESSDQGAGGFKTGGRRWTLKR